MLVIKDIRMTSTNFACHHDSYRRAKGLSNSIFEEFYVLERGTCCLSCQLFGSPYPVRQGYKINLQQSTPTLFKVKLSESTFQTNKMSGIKKVNKYTFKSGNLPHNKARINFRR